MTSKKLRYKARGDSIGRGALIPLSPPEAYYRARVAPRQCETARQRDNIAYALCSVHVSTDESDALFTAWRDAGRPGDYPAIMAAWNGTGAQYQPTKAAWLTALMDKPDSWITAHARDRVALDTLPGLGFIKASFAAALNGAPAACLDRHILRSLRARAHAYARRNGATLPQADQRIQPRTWTAYRALERVLVARHGGTGDPFVAQWATWNALRGTRETHAVLWSNLDAREEAPF